MQLSAALEALASVSSCEEADQSPGPPPPPPTAPATAGAGAALAAGKAHSLESAPDQPVRTRDEPLRSGVTNRYGLG